MIRRLQLCSVLFAWLLATGSHWDLVQTFAWGRMFGGYVQTMPLTEAIRLTFAPDNLCPMCEMVKEAKQQKGDTALPSLKLDGKILLVFLPASQPEVVATTAEPWVLQDEALPVTERAAPPLPPPRARLAA